MANYKTYSLADIKSIKSRDHDKENNGDQRDQESGDVKMSLKGDRSKIIRGRSKRKKIPAYF